MEIVDIHSHILPGVDDGAQDMEMTKQMIEVLHRQGVRSIFATPHISMRSREDKPRRVAEAYKKVKQFINETYPDMQIYLGCEVYMEPGMLEKIKNEPSIALNGGRYVLCEFAFTGRYKEMYEFLQQLVRARYKPVIAHVERYTCLMGKWDRINELREMGILMQMNAESLSGKWLDKRYKYGKQLIQAEVIDFVGSDAHDMSSRKPLMDQAQRTLEKLLGTEKAKCILETNAQVFLK